MAHPGPGGTNRTLEDIGAWRRFDARLAQNERDIRQLQKYVDFLLAVRPGDVKREDDGH